MLRTIRIWVSLAVAVMACGRIAFDPLDDARPAIDTPIDPCTGVDVAGCTIVPCAALPGCLLYCDQAVSLNWPDAQADCAARGGHIACLPTQAAIDCVVAGRGTSPGTWLGLVQLTSTTLAADWTWQCDGSTFNSIGWAPGEPNDSGATTGTEDGDEQCGALVVAGFNDGRCTIDTGDWACEVP